MVEDETGCGGRDGVSVMFISQGINGNGPNSYYAVDMIKNMSRMLPVSKL